MCESLIAGPPSAQILPNNTKQYILLPDVHRFDTNIAQTVFSKMAANPKLKPLFAEIRKRVDTLKIGIDWKELKTIGSGEISFALVPDSNKHLATVFTLHAKDKSKSLNAFVTQIAKRLTKHGFRQTRRMSNRTTIVSFHKTSGGKLHEVHFFVKDEMLVMSDRRTILNSLLGRWQFARADSLENVKEFRETRKTCEAQSKHKPDVFLFVDPFGLTEAWNASQENPDQEIADTVRKLRKEGFDAVRAIGGTAYIGTEGRLAELYISIYAPPPYRNSMRMFRFAGGNSFEPPLFVPTNSATFLASSFDIHHAFKHVGSLFDTFVAGRKGKGTFQQIVTDMRDDPEGPQVDLEKQVVGKLHPQIFYVLDVPKNFEPYREEFVVAIRTSNEAYLRSKIELLLYGDPNFLYRKIRGRYHSWALLSDKNGKLNRKTVKSVISIANGHLLVASNLKILEKVLFQVDGRLAQQDDFQMMQRHFAKIPGKHVMRIFSRPEHEFRNIYDLYKNGKTAMASSASPLYRMLVLKLGNSVDRSKLPAFAELIRYFGPVGIAVTNRSDGWLLSAVALENEQKKK